MKRRERTRSTGFFSMAQTIRLFSLLLMLVVIGVTIQRSAPWRNQAGQ